MQDRLINLSDRFSNYCATLIPPARNNREKKEREGKSAGKFWGGGGEASAKLQASISSGAIN